MASNYTAYDAFWKGKKCTGSSTHSTGDKLFSYGTVILQRLPDGKTIGNITKYSNTTSKHQSQGRVHSADMLVDAVRRGVIDLIHYTQGGSL